MNLRHALYRAKRKDNGEWVYGNLIHRTKFYGTPTDDYLILAEGEFHEDYYEAYEVDPNTIGECSFLEDKNKKIIFEGDVLKIPSWVFTGGQEFEYCVCRRSNPNHETWPFVGIGLFCEHLLLPTDEWDEFEIVGNRYDNPDLYNKTLFLIVDDLVDTSDDNGGI